MKDTSTPDDQKKNRSVPSGAERNDKLTLFKAQLTAMIAFLHSELFTPLAYMSSAFVIHNLPKCCIDNQQLRDAHRVIVMTAVRNAALLRLLAYTSAFVLFYRIENYGIDTFERLVFGTFWCGAWSASAGVIDLMYKETNKVQVDYVFGTLQRYLDSRRYQP